jgi:hypothetical protein
MVRARPAESTGALRSRQHEYAGKPQGASPIVFSQGFRFFLAENGVWLVEMVPSCFVERRPD